MSQSIPTWLINHSFPFRQQILSERDFIKLNSDEDRIKSTVAGLIKYGFDIEGRQDEVKSSVASETYRRKGNKVFATGVLTPPALESVWELYSTSVVYALPKTKELSLAYGNRSAVLFKANRYEECLLDIDRAVCTGYPDDLKPKLLIRKAKSIYASTGRMNAEVDNILKEVRMLIKKLPPQDKNRQAIENILNNPKEISSIGKFVQKTGRIDYVPQLQQQNPNLPGASDAIKLKYAENYGTHMVATRKIKAGEVIMLQKPYSTIVGTDAKHNLCAHCTKQNWCGIPCDHCVHVMYCSDKCRRAAWSEYHDIECQVLGLAIPLKYNSWTGLRLTVKAFKEAGSFEKLKEYLNKLDSLKNQGPDIEIPLDPTSYSSIYVICDYADCKSPGELLYWSSNAVEITYFLATRTELFGEKLKRDLEIVKDMKWFTFAAALMSRNMRISSTRTAKISIKNPSNGRMLEIYTLVPTYAFLNHSCCSSAALFPFAGAMAVITPVPINKGDQVFTSYGPHFMAMKKEERAELLKSDYYFKCNCDACKYDWSAETCTPYETQGLRLRVLSKLHKTRMILAKCFEEIAYNDTVDMKKMGKEFCDAMDQMYPYVRCPCSEVEQLVKVLDEVFCSFNALYIPSK